MAKGNSWIQNDINEERLAKVRKLNEIAANRGQKLSQMAISWALRDGKVTTVLIGASRAEQIVENAAAVEKLEFSPEEITAIENILAE